MKKVTPKILRELKEQNNSRGEMREIVTKFLLNASHRMVVMDFIKKHHMIDKAENEILLRIAAGQYISSVVSCWETIFRDAFVFIAQTNAEIKCRVDQRIQTGSSKPIIHELDRENISLSEFISENYNFQNLKSTCEAFNFLVNENRVSIFSFGKEVLDSNDIYVSNRAKSFSQPSLNEVITAAFEIRHKVTHDANFMMEYNSKQMDKMEEGLIIFPQLLTTWLSLRFTQKINAISLTTGCMRLTESLNDDERVFILGADDLRAKWRIID